MASSSSSSSSRSWKYDVFLSFRGEDTRKTFVDHLYSALQRHATVTYKDDVTLDRGDTIGPSLVNAIQSSQILVIIFSENYAESSWCLDELSHIMKCKDSDTGQIVFPIFYHVDPSDVRKQKRKYEEAFAKHELSENGRNKVETWKKALVDASNIAGWEPKHVANGHEARCIQEIVDSILNRLSSLGSTVEDKELVGMGTRLEQLRSQLGVGSGGVRMVGIWGVGGGGKTTLAFSAYNKLRVHFHGHCFIGNIREKSQQINGLEKLQETIISEVLKTQESVTSVQEGRCKIQSMLCRRNVLIVLDDVDHPEQLKALAGSREWFGEGSRILITTRDHHLLMTHRVDMVSPISLLSYGEAVRLFSMHAYNENKPVEDYKMLSKQIVSYAAGLPLALIVLGSFLYDKNKDEWLDTLDRLKDHPEMDIVKKLKISYDGLKPVEKELFLDIACFFRRKRKGEAVKILDACGLNPAIGVKVLKQKALITVSKYGEFDMHDLVQEMAHYIVRGAHPSNPEEHSRLWRNKDIQDLCLMHATMENDKIEAVQCIADGWSSNFNMLVSNSKKLRFLKVTNGCFLKYRRIGDPSFFENELRYTNWDDYRTRVSPESSQQRKLDEGPSFLSNELRYIDWESYPASPFPESFRPRKLVVLKLKFSWQKELWTGYKYLPCLKELKLVGARKLVRTPDFGGLPCLQKLILRGCHSLEEIHQSLGNHSSLVYVSVGGCKKLSRFPTIVKMDKLQSLIISDGGFPMIEAKMDNFVECLPSFKELELYCLSKFDFTALDFSFSRLTCLKLLQLNDCNNLVELPELPSSLAILRLYDCKSLEVIKDDAHRRCKSLCEVSISGERKNITGGERLLESMLQGNAVESRCMILRLSGLEIPRGFEPRVVRGERCRMQLPENWYNHFSGFLICAVVLDLPLNITIRMKHEKLTGDWMRDSQDCVYWEETVNDKYNTADTYMIYISFGFLRNTSWWDQTSTAIELEIDSIYGGYNCVIGCKSKLIPKRSETSITDSSFDDVSDDYTCSLKIHHDSKSLMIMRAD